MPTERGAGASGSAAVLHVLYLIFNEGYTSSAGPNLAARRAVERGDPPDPRGARLLPNDGEVGGPARADAADRRAARGANRPGRRADPAQRAGSRPVGPAGHRRGRRARHRDARRGARSARTSSRPRSPRCTTRRRAPRTPTGRRSWRSTACSSACPTTRWCALNHAIAAAMVHGAAGRPRAAGRARRRTSASPATTASTPSARTCSSWPATARPRSRTTARPPAARRAFPSGTTSPRRRRASPPSLDDPDDRGAKTASGKRPRTKRVV